MPVTESAINDFCEYLAEVQHNMKTFRKRLSTQNDHEWNAKAQLVFTHEHMGCVMRNLRRSIENTGREIPVEGE